MNRVMIIGSAGSGKSTLAQRLGAQLDLPVYHIDREVFWLPNWVERPKPEQREIVKAIVARDQWVFECQNSSTYLIRAARADMLIWLDTPLALWLWRVTRRQSVYLGQSRPDMAEGCVEKLSQLPGFLWFIVRTAKGSRRKARAFFDGFKGPKHRFTSAAQVNAYLAQPAAQPAAAPLRSV